MKTESLRSWAIVGCLLLCVWLTAVAQSPQGTITGTVTDANGGVVTGANVTALNPATNQKYSTTTSSDGVFALPALPIGLYEITVSAQGFSTAKQNARRVQLGLRLSF